MKLYRHELGSDDDAEDVWVRKKFIGEFESLQQIITCIGRFYAPISMRLIDDESIKGCRVLVALPCTIGTETPDEALWILEPTSEL